MRPSPNAPPPARRPRLLPAGLAVAAVALFGARVAVAQEDFDIRLLKPTVTIMGSGSPDKGFKDESIDGEYGEKQYDLRANIPLGPAHVHPQASILGDQFMLNVAYGTRSQDLTFLPDQPRLYQGTVSLSALLLSKKFNIYYFAAGASYAEDRTSLSDVQTRPFAVGLGTHRTKGQWLLVYGGAFTYVYGRGLLLPLFGVVKKINDHWVFAGAVPFFWRFTDIFNQKVRLSYILRAAGQRFRIDNSGGIFPGQDPEVYERVVEGRLGAQLEYRANKSLTLLAEAGEAFGRRLEFNNLHQDPFFDQQLRPAPYALVGLRFGIGKSIFDEAPGSKGTPGD